jgi:hypothetical protein
VADCTSSRNNNELEVEIHGSSLLGVAIGRGERRFPR